MQSEAGATCVLLAFLLAFCPCGIPFEAIRQTKMEIIWCKVSEKVLTSVATVQLGLVPVWFQFGSSLVLLVLAIFSSNNQTGDEPAHLVLTYTPLFSPFITFPPLQIP